MDEFEAEGLKLRALIAQQKNGKTHAGPSKLSYAIAYARRGMRVFPCHHIESDNECSCGKLGCSSAGKHPRHKGWQEQATTDEDVIRQMWAEAPEANVGVACGETSGITVLDVDGDLGRETLHDLELANGELPLTPIVLTPSGGMHLYFLHEPGLPNAVRFAPGLDVRNDGGLVIGAGSRTKRAYEPEVSATFGEVEVSRMRPWLADLIRPAIAPTTKFTAPDLTTMVEGKGRNDLLFRSGRSLKAQNLPAEVIRTSMITTNSSFRQPLSDQERDATIANVLKQPDRPGFGVPAKREETLPATVGDPFIEENSPAATTANDRYLARPPVVDRLGYTESIMLMIGGKHHGKTSNIRTLALSVSRGLPIWGRDTTQGHVLYVASADEVASTRYELLQMGWDDAVDSLTFLHLDPDTEASPDQLLEKLAEKALQKQAKLIILDMLFDFVAISDELSYAGTRMAIGAVQHLADVTKSLVVCSHHTPKYLTDVHSASNAALGSQGVAARFSPIVFTRKWADDLYTVESTLTRDPRGEELTPQRIERNEQGWIEVVGPFKEWMKWRVYARRVLELFEDNKGLTVHEAATKLDLDRSRVQNVLKQLEGEGSVVREKQGRKFVYYRSGVDMFEREGGNFSGGGDGSV